MSVPVGTGRALGVAMSVQEFDQITVPVDGKVGFFGVTPAAQLAAATQATITATWVSISSGFGFQTSDQAISMIAVVKEIQHVLTTLGLWKGAA